MEFREAFGWVTDDAPETTPAVVAVSACGVVKRLKYKFWNVKNEGYSSLGERVIKQSANRGKQRKDGGDNKYQHVCVGRKSHSVHRLVALAWIPNPLNKPQVNHKNGIKSDNRVENLEWVTNAENRAHAMAMGLPRKSLAKVSKEQIEEMLTLRNSGKKLLEIGSIYGVTGECVRWNTKKIMTPAERASARQRNNRWKNHEE